MATALPDVENCCFSCPICLEQYKIPKILPCHHTFCQGCLMKIVQKDGELKCSVCRTPCELPDNGVPGLKDNVIMNALLETDASSQPELCQGCDENKASNKCLDCDINFCLLCTRSHGRSKVTKNHTLITLKEYKAEMSSRRLLPQKVYCNVHPENEIKYYCETCDVTMCTDCAATEHRSERHVHKVLKEAAEIYTILLQELVGRLREKWKENEKSASETKQIKDQLQLKGQEEERKVRKKAEELVQKIRMEEKRLVENIQTDYGQKVKTAEIQIDEWEMRNESISCTCEYINTLIQCGSGAQLMSYKQQITQQVEALIATETKANPKPSVVEFLPVITVTGLGMLGEFGEGILGVPSRTDTRSPRLRQGFSSRSTVNPPTPELCASKCTVNNLPSRLQEGESAEIVITTKNSHGRQVIPTPVLKAEVRKPDGTRQDVKVTDNRDGTLALAVRGEVDGNHQVTLMVGDKPIQGSPFSIRVTKRLVKTLGMKGNRQGCFNSPCCVIINAKRQLVVGDGNRRLEVIDMDGNPVTSIPFTNFMVGSRPRDIAVSDDGNYFFTSSGVNKICVSDGDGNFIRCFGKQVLKYPLGIAISPVDGAVYVSDWDGKGHNTDKTTHCVRKFTQNGRHVKSIGSYGTGPAQFIGPYRLCISRNGRVYIPDINNHRIQVFDQDLLFLFQFGYYGDGNGDLNWPVSVAVDKDEFLYVAEQGARRVQKFDCSGRYICRIGREEDGLILPCAVAVSDDKIVVVDCKSDCLKVFTH